jgi:hypothetical protein
MITPLVELDDSVARRATLPTVLISNAEELLRRVILWAVALVGRAFANSTSLLGAFAAASDVIFDGLGRDEG